jgi:hypothetical protein
MVLGVKGIGVMVIGVRGWRVKTYHLGWYSLFLE